MSQCILKQEKDSRARLFIGQVIQKKSTMRRNENLLPRLSVILQFCYKFSNQFLIQAVFRFIKENHLVIGKLLGKKYK